MLKVEDTVRGFKEILEGKYDDLPEQAFYMVGGIEEVVGSRQKIGSGSLMPSLKIDIVTAERVVYSAEVDAVIAPGVAGQLGILPHHAPLMTILQAGELVVRKGGAGRNHGYFRRLFRGAARPCYRAGGPGGTR